MSARSLILGFAALLLAGPAAAEPPTPEAVVDAFEAALGPITTYRPSHPKGICASGHFVATPDGARYSSAPVFDGQRVETIIRFGVAGGNPRASDVARSTRSLAIRFETSRGDQWDMANISAPIFGARTPEMLVAGLLARRPGPNGQPDADAVRRYIEANPEAMRQGRWLASVAPPASWATTPYWGVNAFRFKSADGQERLVRWVFEPVAGTQRLSEEEMRTRGTDFLGEEIRRRVAQGPVEFDMVLQFAQPGDDASDPTVAWPDDRPRATVGRLTVTSVEAGPGGPCDGISFMNLDMEPGVAFSDDPTLHARPAPYAVSLTRRTR
ncbi:catalase family peroxidase [Sabulicella rubraurantiaca]|uniref:catalase family peroxidase n=1 Tax=Sabulicella rubraurantiaca TaxID=2811429 RepID=UPI001A956B6D|nr:catalase family peroxidase [Sabulicella rubraurantiaca]